MQILKNMAGAFNPDDMNDFMFAAEASIRRYETNIDSICAKYGQAFEDSDIICMKTGNILNDRGTVKKLKPVQFGGAKLAITKRRADKLTTTLSNSQLDISNRPADAQSICSNYVGASANQSHFADDATKLLSFISVEDNEPSDAETISSGDSSNALEENTSDSDSYFDDLDGGDFNLLPGRVPGTKPGCEVNLRNHDKVWYSFGSSSEHSAQESNTSCKRVFGSINSRSREVFSKTEDSESTEDDLRGNGSSLSRGNVEKHQQTEDSGFESGPGKRVVHDSDHRQHGRLFCLNDDKINRVMNWVKDQAKENVHFPPPESVSKEQDSSPAEESLRSPVKVRKTDRHSFRPVHAPHSELEPPVPQSPIFKPIASNMNKTYCVPVGVISQIPKAISGKENIAALVDSSNNSLSRQITQSKMNDTTTSVLLDNSDVASWTESGCLTPRRIVRARKRAFTPVQPSYTSEELLDYLTSHMPETMIEVMSPSRVRQTIPEPNIPVPVPVPTPPPTPEKSMEESDENCLPCPEESAILKNSQPQCHEKLPFSQKNDIEGGMSTVNQVNDLRPSQLNNLNKDVTRESNVSSADVLTTAELGIIVQHLDSRLQPGSPSLHESVGRHDDRRLSEGDDAVTLCEGFGGLVQPHDHVLSQVPQAVRTPTDSSKQETPTGLQCRSAGFGSKKQIFDRLKNAGCSSDSKVHSERKQSKMCVRARRQLAMGQTREKIQTKQQSKHEQNKVLTPHIGNERNQFPVDQSIESVSYEEQSFLSFEEHRVSFMYEKQSTTYLQEDMDIDCGESADNTHEPKKVVINEELLTDDIKLLKKPESKSSQGSLSSLQRSKPIPDYNTNNRQDSHAEKSFNLSAVPIPSSSARQEPSDVKSSSPVCCRKTLTSVPGMSLSPSTALSQLQINSPSQTKATRPTPHKKPSKELFSVPVDYSVNHPHKQLTFGSLKVLKDNIPSHRKKDSSLNNVKKTPSKSMSRSPRKYTEDCLLKDVKQMSRSPRKYAGNCLLKDAKQSPRKSLSKSPPKYTDDSLLKDAMQSPRKILSQSQRKYTDDGRTFSVPSVDSLTVTRIKPSHNVPKPSSSYKCLVTINDPRHVTKTKNSKTVPKPEFLIPDKSAFKSLKPIKSKKNKATEPHMNNLQTSEINLMKNRPANFHHLVAIHSSRCTSTPAKGQNVPRLNDTMSTICHGVGAGVVLSDEDEEEEVRTISPYSFQSESLIDT